MIRRVGMKGRREQVRIKPVETATIGRDPFLDAKSVEQGGTIRSATSFPSRSLTRLRPARHATGQDRASLRSSWLNAGSKNRLVHAPRIGEGDRDRVVAEQALLLQRLAREQVEVG